MSYQIYLKTVDKPAKKLGAPSCLRRQASRNIQKHWIPAFAGMTSKDDFKTFYETITVGQSKFICP